MLRVAQEQRMKASVDLVSEHSECFARVVQPALPFVDYLFLNEFEIGQVTGIATTPRVGSTGRRLNRRRTS